MFSIIGTIIFGGIAGLIAGLIRKGKGYGIFWNIIIGIAGGAIGSFLFGIFGFNTSDSNWIANIIVSTVGALVLLTIINFFGRKDV
jgi:uncharacterized membrane protein YeaQ/YmgE (transglycosylase-associated protein family)